MTVCIDNPRHNLWQSKIWQDFQNGLGRKTWMLESAGAHALVIKHSLPLGLCWLEVPRGPLFQTPDSLVGITEKLKALGQKERAIFVRLSPFDPAADIPGAKPTKYDKHPQTSLIIDLTQSEEDILKQMKQKGRYNIRVAEKHNVSIEPSYDVDAFYDLLQKTTERDEFSAHPKSYYQAMLTYLGEHAQLLVAKYQGKVIAAGIFVYLNNFGIYYYGASDHAYRKYMATYLLQWIAMLEAKRRGCKKYDFLGIAPEDVKDHAWSGVTRFKKKFGGQVVNYPQAKDLVIRPFWYRLYKIYKSIR